VDNRYPWLIPVDRLPPDFKGRRAIRSFAKRVRDNTTCLTAYNRRTGRLFFYYRTVDTGVWDHDVRDLSERALAGVCTTIKSGRLSAAEKDWILSARERDFQASVEQNKGRYHESKRRDAERLADSIIRGRVTSGYGSKGAI